MIRELQHFLADINTKQERAWEHLYKDYYTPLCCYAMKILKDQELVRDVVQGVIIRLWETEAYFDDLPSLHGYLYKAVYNNSLKVLRNKSTEEQYLAAQKEEETVPEAMGQAVIEEEVVRRLRYLIDRMPEKRKEVMLLCLEEKKVEEISQILGISVNTVKKHKKEAYEAIRQTMPSDMLVLFFLFFP